MPLYAIVGEVGGGPRRISDIGQSRSQLEANQREARRAGAMYDIYEASEEEIQSLQSGRIVGQDTRKADIGLGAPKSTEEKERVLEAAQAKSTPRELQEKRERQYATSLGTATIEFLQAKQMGFRQAELQQQTERRLEALRKEQERPSLVRGAAFHEISPAREQSLKREVSLLGGDGYRNDIRTTRDSFRIDSSIQNRELDLQKNKGFSFNPVKTLQKDFSSRTEQLGGEFERALLKSQKDTSKVRQTGLIISYLGFRTAKGALNPIIHPIETFKGIFKPETYIGIYKSFKEEPIGTSAELSGGLLTGKVLGKGISKATTSEPFIAVKGKLGIKSKFEVIKLKEAEVTTTQEILPRGKARTKLDVALETETKVISRITKPKPKTDIPSKFVSESVAKVGEFKIGKETFPQIGIQKSKGISRFKPKEEKLFEPVKGEKVSEPYIGLSKIEPFEFTPKQHGKIVEIGIKEIDFLKKAPAATILEVPRKKISGALGMETAYRRKDRGIKTTIRLGKRLGGEKAETLEHELFHSFVSRKTKDVFGYGRGQKPRVTKFFTRKEFGIIRKDIVRKFKKDYPRKTKQEVLLGLESEYAARGYSRFAIPEEVSADLYATFKTRPARFKKDYPRIAKLFERKIPQSDITIKYEKGKAVEYISKSKIAKAPKTERQGIISTTKVKLVPITQTLFRQSKGVRPYAKKLKLPTKPTPKAPVVSDKSGTLAGAFGYVKRKIVGFEFTPIGFKTKKVGAYKPIIIDNTLPPTRELAIQKYFKNERLIAESIAKPKPARKSKPIISVKPSSKSFAMPFSTEQYGREQRQYPLVLIDEVIPARKSKPIIDINKISIPKPIITPIVSQFQQPKPITQPSQRQLPREIQIPRIDVKPIQEQKPIQDIKPILETWQTTEQKRDFPFRDIITEIPRKPKLFGFALPKFKSRKLKGFTGKPFKTKSKYIPSIVAGVFNIRGKRPKVITQLGVRPLPLLRKRKRKKN